MSPCSGRQRGGREGDARCRELTVLSEVARKAPARVIGTGRCSRACATIQASCKQTSIQLLAVRAHVAVWTIAVVLIGSILDTVAVVQARVGEASIRTAGGAELSHFSDQS